jgi:hypothetical protein
VAGLLHELVLVLPPPGTVRGDQDVEGAIADVDAAHPAFGRQLEVDVPSGELVVAVEKP